MTVPAPPQKNDHSGVAKTAISFAGVNLASTIIRFLGNLITVRLVIPEALGLFNGLTLIQSYIAPFHLGVHDGLSRQLPFLMGQGKKEQAMGVVATAAQWAKITSLIAGGAALIVALWFAANNDWQRAAAWGTNAICIVTILFASAYLQATFRTAQDFSKLAKANLIQSIFVACAVSLLFLSEYFGLCARASLASIIFFAYLWWQRPYRIHAQWSKENFKYLFSIGFPILIVNAMSLWWGALDNTFVLIFMGHEGLGLYALSSLTCSTASLLPQAFSQVLYPRLSYDYGKQNDTKSIIVSAWRQSLKLFCVNSLLAFVLWPLLPVILPYLAPKYADGIKAAQWSLILVAVLSFSPVQIVFNVLRRQKEAFIVISLGIITYTVVLLSAQQISGLDLTLFPKALIMGRFVQYSATALVHFHILNKS